MARAQELRLAGELGLLDAALEHTRAGRVLELADQSAPHLVDLLGPLPSSPGGRAVWCHHALYFETMIDRGSTLGSWRGKSQQLKPIRQQISVADRTFRAGTDTADPVRWAKVAAEAAKVLEGLETLISARSRLQASGRVAGVTSGTSVEEQSFAGPGIDL